MTTLSNYYCNIIWLTTHLLLLHLLHLLQAKYVEWTLTYSPPDETQGCPKNILDWIKAHARKYLLVEEMASKKHIQCAFITQKGYCRSWGNKARKDLGYSNIELQIHTHNDFLGALGYQEGDILECVGFSQADLAAARKHYKNRLQKKYYHDHLKTMTGLMPSQVNPLRAHVMEKEGLEEYDAEQRMVAMGFIWPGMKPTDVYVAQCTTRDTVRA